MNFLSNLFNKRFNPKLSIEKSDLSLVIIDVGCRGGFAEKFICDDKLFDIYGFEPDIEESQKLIKQYRQDNISIIPIALAETTGKRTLFITQNPACSSLLQPDPYLTNNYPALYCARYVSSIEVETTTLDKWVEENDINAIDYIKIDTQGTELEILRGGSKILKYIRCLEVEVEFNPIYLGQPVFSDIDKFLRDRDFILWKLTNQVHYSKGVLPGQEIGIDSIFYDEIKEVRHPIYAGQLFWANAHYIHKSVLDVSIKSPSQQIRDERLLQALGLIDIVAHLQTSNLNTERL